MARIELLDVLLEDDLSEHPVVTLRVVLTTGTLLLMAEIIEVDRVAIARNLHVTVLAGDLRRNMLGPGVVRGLVTRLMEMHGYDAFVVEGGFREAGEGRGRRPRPLRFARKLPADR